MAAMENLSWTFDTHADAYEKLRPGYVAALYDAIFRYVSIDKGSHAVEVGIGGGQATRSILDAGCQVTAVEPGEHFCGLCREKFKAYPGFKVINAPFEQADLPPNSCELVYSASAFHWIPEQVGYEKVHAILKQGGTFARFANHPSYDKGQKAMAEDIERQYSRYFAPFYGEKQGPPPEYTEDMAKNRALLAEKYGFTDCRWYLFHRTRSFRACEYTALLGTYSDHINLPEDVRREFFHEIEEAIDRHGGCINLCDTLDLQLARKP